MINYSKSARLIRYWSIRSLFDEFSDFNFIFNGRSEFALKFLQKDFYVDFSRITLLK